MPHYIATMDLVEIKIHQSELEKRHPWETARFDFFIKKMSSYINFQQPITVMDVGCGDAYFIATLKRKFPQINCVGVDINFTPEIKTAILERYKDCTLQLFTTVEEAKQQVGKVDLILLMDVIEHIADDISFLKNEILPVMESDKCYTFITVPAYQFLFTKHDEFLGHYRRYNNKLLKKNVALSGINSRECGYFFTTLIGLRLIEKTLDTINPQRNAEGIANWNGGPGLTNFVESVLKIDYSIGMSFHKMGINIPGLSNYIVCKQY